MSASLHFLYDGSQSTARKKAFIQTIVSGLQLVCRHTLSICRQEMQIMIIIVVIFLSKHVQLQSAQ
jgi:hypothetical protein